jgi:hypothetical protein
MITVGFKGIIKLNRDIPEWYAQDKNGEVIDSDFLDVVDRFLEGFNYDVTKENEEIEIIIKVNRKDN